ncbi:YolD-like family protein [Amphibacillus sp. Q70]|uniref:YolD-like family protein n=1 Tax=Bacillaceae TaxID=186817 RepID=UPI0008265CD2|nr:MULTISPECIES: YolD-like family protein [Gracilibacillus]
MNERGTIKWTSLMLPEHVQMLNEWTEEDNWKTKPILDEQQIEENSMKLQLAIHNNLTVEIKHYKDRYFHMAKGKLYKIDIVNKYIKIDNEERTKINLNDLIDVAID